jgi:DNA-binding GntR family transcriptional regulator
MRQASARSHRQGRQGKAGNGASPKLVSHLADQIAAKIASGAFPPGFKLRQEALADEFSVSRMPVREALRQLEARGLVLHVHNQGSIVHVPTAKQIREAYQVRAELEGLACELAVQWISDAQLERMRQAQTRFAQVVDGLASADSRKKRVTSNWVESNEAFHDVIMEAAGNEKLREIIRNLHLNFTRNVMLSAGAMDGRRMRENVVQHEAILAALERHDPVEARRTMVHHVLRSGEVAIRWLESRGTLAPSAG